MYQNIYASKTLYEEYTCINKTYVYTYKYNISILIDRYNVYLYIYVYICIDSLDIQSVASLGRV